MWNSSTEGGGERAAPVATPRLTLAGVGTRSSGDDAIGLCLVEAMAGQAAGSDLECLLWEDADALTLANELLAIERDIIIVDCADLGLAGGSWRFFPLESARLLVRWDALSTHGLGPAEALTLARALGFARGAWIFGVQPFDLSPSPGLSPRMRSSFAALLGALRTALPIAAGTLSGPRSQV